MASQAKIQGSAGGKEKCAGRGTWSGHAQQDFGRGNEGQTLQVRDKEMHERTEVHGRKGWWMLKEVRWSGDAQQDYPILGGECGTKQLGRTEK